jgi:hypothetical protein
MAGRAHREIPGRQLGTVRLTKRQDDRECVSLDGVDAGQEGRQGCQPHAGQAASVSLTDTRWADGADARSG